MNTTEPSGFSESEQQRRTNNRSESRGSSVRTMSRLELFIRGIVLDFGRGSHFSPKCPDRLWNAANLLFYE
jgi:hypothetical protein